MHVVRDGRVTFRQFASVRAAGLCPARARGYYEVEVLSELSYPQLGFCSGEWGRVEGYVNAGVGDDEESWGVDGDRMLKWHRGDGGRFGSAWRRGDVVGLACDLQPAGGGGGRLLVSVNGDFAPPNGAAFDLPPGLAGLHAALTCGAGAVSCNLGGDPARPLRHSPPAPGFRPMAAFPAPALQ